jgi:hypothetical protein
MQIISANTPPQSTDETYLPRVQLVLLGLVLLDEIFEHLLQAFRVGGESWEHILHCLLHQDSVDETEGLAVSRKWLQGFQDKPTSQPG